jgi:hypothetical protein
MLNGALLMLPHEAKAFPVDAWITGSVTDGMGPVPNVYVKAMLFMADMEEVNYTFTDADGNYTMGVPGGLEFMVLAADGSHYMAMDIASVSPGETKFLNFTLQPIAPIGTNVTLKGYVLDEYGTPVTAGHVIGYSSDPSGGDMPSFANLTTPNGTGYFELNVISSPTGGGVISFDFAGYPPSENATDSPIVDGMTYWFNLTLSARTYNDDAFIYGYVTDVDTGLPLSSALVSIDNENPFNQESGYSNYTLTNETGYYEMNIQNGTGELIVRKLGYSMKMFWLDIPEGASVRQDAQLRLCDAIIRGNVTDLASGDGIPFARVFLFDNPSDPWSGNMSMVMTDGTGYYELDAFSGTDLVLGAEAEGYSREFMTINVTTGDELWQDIGLWPANAFIEGHVTDAATGMPLYEAWIHLTSDRYETWVGVDGSGYYNSSVVPGDYDIEAWAPDYWPYYSTAVATEGNTTVHDIVMMPWMSAQLVGTVTDLFTGVPIPGASVSAGTHYFWNSTMTNATGEYTLGLAAGYYQVYVSAPGYYDNRSEVTLDNLTTLVHNISLTPYSPPTDTRLYGHVYDIDTMSEIPFANVRINLPDLTYSNQTSANETGFYEMYVPSWELDVTCWAHWYGVDFQTIDTTGLTDYSLDLYLKSDQWAPNLTYSQAPTENVSSLNPSITDLTVEDENLRQMYLFLMMWWNTTSGGSNYTLIMFNGSSLDPLNYWDSLGYVRVGNNYSVHLEWPAMIEGGWLENSTESAYFPSSTQWMGPERFNAIRGVYSNGTVSGMTGSAMFNYTSGEFVMFYPDSGPPIMAPDPTGVFEPYGTVAEFIGGNLWPSFFEQRSLGSWSVNGLTFTSDYLVPSGDYRSMFWASDWGDSGVARMVNMTVDNDAPVADAGPDLFGVVNTTFELNASLSYDNVGIVSYVWEYTDGYGQQVVLSSSEPAVDHVFNTTGVFVVTLTVADAAGHETSDQLTVTVLDDMPPVADAGPDQSVDEDTLVQFDGSSSSDDIGIVNFTWEIVELAAYMYDSMPTYTFDTPGIYHVTLTVTDTIGQTGTDQVVITVADTTDPVAAAGPDETIMGGLPYLLNGSASFDNVGVVNWTWTFVYQGTPQTLYGETVWFTFWAEGVYNITLNVTDAAGNWATDEVQITVSGIIPEFPSVLMPVVSMLLIALVIVLRRRSDHCRGAPPEDGDL